jgi:hypothetical protein
MVWPGRIGARAHRARFRLAVVGLTRRHRSCASGSGAAAHANGSGHRCGLTEDVPLDPFELHRDERLMVRRRGGRKRALGTRAPMLVPQRPNDWSPDFRRRPVHRRPPSAHPGRGRRLHPRVPGAGPRHLDLGHPGGPRVGRLRDELLNETLSRSLPHARAMLETWRIDYITTGRIRGSAG